MDTDDTVPEECGRRLRELVEGPHDPRTLGYVMQVHCPGVGEDGEMTVVDHVKPFRNHPAIRFECRIHEQLRHFIRRRASVDPLGNCITTVYDDAVRLETSVSEPNHCTEFSYDAADNLSQKYNMNVVRHWMDDDVFWREATSSEYAD